MFESCNSVTRAVCLFACSVLHNANLRVYQHPAKKIHFLVGRRGKGDLLAIGGRWEPVDGGHPARDPSSLVATAIRTFRAATGVDLSRCSHWWDCSLLF